MIATLVGGTGCLKTTSGSDSPLNQGSTPAPTPGASAVPTATPVPSATPSPTPSPTPTVLSALPVVSFSNSYKANHFETCSSSANYGIAGFAPATTGVKYPLFVYTVGTFDTYNNPLVLEILSYVASQGFVAVSLQYDNGFAFTCSDGRIRSKCMYDPSEANSAVSKVCSRNDANCNLGIVTAGHSQGAGMAIFAKNWNTRIRANYLLALSSASASDLLSGGTWGFSHPTSTSLEDTCMLKANLAISKNRLRAMNGQNDTISRSDQVQRVTGSNCAADASNCLNSDGSGWSLVANSAVADQDADHGYFFQSSSAGSVLDPGFAPPATHEWSLATNVSWLKKFVGPYDVPQRLNTGFTGSTLVHAGEFSKDDKFLSTANFVFTTSNVVNVAGVTHAAPASVYQSQRYEIPGRRISYALDNLAPNTSYSVRLHFAELWFNFAGARRFHINVQGARKATDFDIFAEAGAMNKALVKEYTATSDQNGVILLEFIAGSADNPVVNGIEVF